mgnify:CR=1 FL=1
MKRVALSQKVFLLFASLTALTFLVALAVYLGFESLHRINNNIALLQEFQLQIRTLETLDPASGVRKAGSQDAAFESELAKTLELSYRIEHLHGDIAEDLARRLLRLVPDLPRLRLSSVDPAEIDRDLRMLFAEEPRLMPHLHLSVQAGDDLTLKRMRRRHGRADVLRLWVSSVDYSADVPLGPGIVKQLADVYRKVRNTSRYLLGNLHEDDSTRAADHKIARFLAGLGIPMACLLHGYVGFLFGSLKANPWWSTPTGRPPTISGCWPGKPGPITGDTAPVFSPTTWPWKRPRGSG